MLYGSFFDTGIEFLKGVGPDKAALLNQELNIYTFGDLLTHFPFRYVDRTSINKIGDLHEDMPFCQVLGRIEKVDLIQDKRFRRLVAKLRDDTGTIELIWFKITPYIKELLQVGAEFLVFGKPTQYNNKINMVHPELGSTNSQLKISDKTKLQPIYSTTEKLRAKNLDSRGIERLMRQLLDRAKPYLLEILPMSLVKTFKLPSRLEAFENIHFPLTLEDQIKAEKRLKFEELLIVQLALVGQKNYRREKIKGHVFDNVGHYFNTFYNEYLPFELTSAQKRVTKEIRKDVLSGHQMNRLIQGDVGSGKTIVALMSMLLALDNGTQALMMAPTEILAVQHFQNIKKLTDKLGVSIRLLTGSTKQAERKMIKAELNDENLHIAIGTHALLEDWIKFKNLGLAVIDEQHRFGVAQRATMWKKNYLPPHVLVMTATPIPRTLAMTLYGDLDTSVIDEMPPGRKPIITKHVYESARLEVFGFLKKQIALGRQVYIVYPLIEESETLDYNNLMAGYEAISRDFPKPQYQLSIVHGRMNAADKEFEMQRFKRGETQILVSTTVIEVGVDVPNASIMLIESAERFGLSQLHQLRGRVGRGAEQSYCLLMTGYKLSQDAKVRIETMVKTNNGFEIAEVDLKLRGPGDIAGTRQSGLMDFKIANLAADQAILTAARESALRILEADPQLQSADNKGLRMLLTKKKKDQPDWIMIS